MPAAKTAAMPLVAKKMKKLGKKSADKSGASSSWPVKTKGK